MIQGKRIRLWIVLLSSKLTGLSPYLPSRRIKKKRERKKRNRYWWKRLWFFYIIQLYTGATQSKECGPHNQKNDGWWHTFNVKNSEKCGRECNPSCFREKYGGGSPKLPLETRGDRLTEGQNLRLLASIDSGASFVACWVAAVLPPLWASSHSSSGRVEGKLVQRHAPSQSTIPCQLGRWVQIWWEWSGLPCSGWQSQSVWKRNPKARVCKILPKCITLSLGSYGLRKNKPGFHAICTPDASPWELEQHWSLYM